MLEMLSFEPISKFFLEFKVYYRIIVVKVSQNYCTKLCRSFQNQSSLKNLARSGFFITISVIPAPPRLSLNSLVSLESRYGMWAFIVFLFLLWSLNAEMHVPSTSSDLLMLFVSTRFFPLDWVIFTFSLPAKSTNISLPSLVICSFGSVEPDALDISFST